MLTRKAYASEMGFSFGENTRILATGGASANKSILQVASDVFNAPVYTQQTTEAALVGAAYRAKYVLELTRAKEGGNPKALESYYEYIRKLLPEHRTVRVCDPSQDSSDIYDKMLERHHQMVQYMTDHQD